MTLYLEAQTELSIVCQELPKKSGVYCIRNIVTGEEYVGGSDDIKRRVNRHFSALRAGRHYNSRIKLSFEKYGEECFKKFVLELIEVSDLLRA